MGYIFTLSKDLNDKFVSCIDKSGKFKKHKHSAESTTIVEPDTKVCPYCLSEIKYKATRCPHCTSEQPEIESLETQEHDSIKTEQ